MAREHVEKEAERRRSDDAGGSSGDGGVGLQHAGNQAATAVLDTFEIGRADDVAELQADQLAATALAGVPGMGGGVLRRSSSGPDHLGGSQVDADTAAGITAARGGGSALPGAVRGDLERGFGTGLGGVRLHTDARADTLARNVDAAAFTTGQDVFFRQGTYDPGSDAGRATLAHEVAHVVQGGGAATVRRLISAKQFKLSTNTTGHMRGDAVKAIDKHLAEVEKLKAEYDRPAPGGTPTPTTKKKGKPAPPPLGEAEKISNLEKRIALIKEMESMAAAWIADHTIEAPDIPAPTGTTPTAPTGGTAPPPPPPTGGTHTIKDPKRKQRMDGMERFLKGGDYQHPANKGHKEITQKTGIPSLVSERQALEMTMLSLRSSAGTNAPAPLPGGPSSRMKKITEKYEGNAKSMFTKLSPLVNLSIPNAGDSVEVDLEAKVPVDPNAVGFISFHLVLSATRDSVTGEVVGAEGKDNVVLRGELMVGGGVNIADLATIKGELGMYAEASANGTEGALTLLSYGVYKRWRESKLVPSGLISYMWSGRKGEFGYEKSEAWANQVEKEQFADTLIHGDSTDPTKVTDFEANDAYVETGILGKASGKVGKSINGVGAEMEASLTFGGGQRYSKKSVERAKGGTMATKADPTAGTAMDLGNSKLGTRNQVEKSGPGGTKTKEDANYQSGAQQLTADETFYFEIAASADVTPISGGITIMGKFSRPAARGLVNPNPWEADAVELQLNGGFTIPAAGNGAELASKVLRPIATGIAGLPGLVRSLIEQKRSEAAASKKGQKGVGSAFDAAQAAIPTLSQYAKQFGEPDNFTSIGKDLTEATGPTLSSSLELNIAIGFDFVGKSLAVELSTKQKLELEIPLFFEGSITKKKRILALTWDKPGLPNVK